MLRKLLLFPLAFLLMSAAVSHAQTGELEGTVTDAETGEPVPTANVFVLKLNRGATTDLDGEFAVSNIPVGEYTVRITFVGYETFRQKVTIRENQTTELDAELQSGAIGLDDVVVTGYGVEQKREITGSISTVGNEDFDKVPLTNTEGLLQGRASGVQVTTTSGEPGGGFQVRVRGVGSINAGSDPLYIVDGVQISFDQQNEQGDTSPLNAINPNDIESIEVLKDAAASAIYGAQAANGVVLITTKRGQQGDTQISFSSEWGVMTNSREYNFLDAEEWFNFTAESWENRQAALGAPGTGEAVLRSVLAGFGVDPNVDPAEFEGTDWQDFIFQEGFGQEYTLSASGGSETTRFFISGGYNEREGHLIKSNFEQFRIRTNLDHQFTDKLEGTVSTNLSTGTQTSLCQDGFFINCPVSGAAFQNPFTKPFNDDGSFSEFTNFGLTSNPAVVRDELDRTNNNVQIIGNVNATYRFTDWLSLRTLWGLDWRNQKDDNFRSPIATGAPDNGSVSTNITRVLNWNTNTVINASQSFGDHNVSGLVGMEYRRQKIDETQSIGIGLPNGLFNVISATASPDFVQGFDTEFRIASYFGKVDYNFQEKYLLSGTVRTDGSSRFGEDNRWGVFPAVSAGWRISEEDFFEADFVDELKLRASFGITGNNQIGNFASRGLFQVQGSYNGLSALGPDQLANNRLSWEEKREINIGIDFSFFRGRLSGSAEAFKTTNDDLLLARPLPRASGFNSITDNIGELEAEGLEFEMEATLLDRNDLLIRGNLNWSLSSNSITELVGDQEQINSGVANTLAVGQPIGTWFVPKFAGINPADGRPMWFDADGNITYDPTVADRKFTDGGEQDLVGGFGTNISYKRLSINTFFQYSLGGTGYPSTEKNFLNNARGFNMNTLDVVRRRWQEPGDMTDQPKSFLGGTNPTAGNQQSFFTTHTGVLEKTNYLRLKNLTISYDIPKLNEYLNVKRVNLYFTGLNLVTWDDWTGLDPEVAGNSDGEGVLVGRSQRSSIPTARQFVGGINIDF